MGAQGAKVHGRSSILYHGRKRALLSKEKRLTKAFSKKLENLKAAIALHFAHYNFVRIHQSLRVSPAMASQVTDHLWSLEELVNAAKRQIRTLPAVPLPEDRHLSPRSPGATDVRDP